MPNKTLAKLQLALQDFLLDKTVDASELTVATPVFSQQDRLHICHQAYRLRLIEALRKDYPAGQAHISESEFIALATDFIAKYLSHHPSLRGPRKSLPNFSRNHTNWKEHIEVIELAELVDVARKLTSRLSPNGYRGRMGP